MSILFRTDASHAIGSGHLMRCLALADALKRRNCASRFLMQMPSGDVKQRVLDAGHAIEEMEACDDPDSDAAVTMQRLGGVNALVVDHYGLNAEWEHPIKSRVPVLMALDDAPDRLHDCDILLDQNIHHQADAKYAAQARGARLLLGPSYALLRPAFAAARPRATPRSAVHRIIVSFGGSDPTDQSTKTLEALRRVASNISMQCDIILGPSYRGGLAPETGDFFTVLRDPPDLIDRMLKADLAIGGGGVSTWERCCLGLPTLCLAIAENQEAVAQACHAEGVLNYLGPADRVGASELAAEIRTMIAKPQTLKDMSERSLKQTDGQGAGRVVDVMLAMMERLAK